MNKADRAGVLGTKADGGRVAWRGLHALAAAAFALASLAAGATLPRPAPSAPPDAAPVIGAPVGFAPGATQFALRFAAEMVPLGQPHLADPVRADCAVPGRGRWLDSRHWVHDFERPLPGGVRCRFERTDPWRTHDGRVFEGPQRFELHTGGPSVLATDPPVGAHGIDERQAFVLALDAPVSLETVRAHAHCAVDGINEAVPVQVIEAEERRAILARAALRRWPGEPAPQRASDRDAADARRLVLRCARSLPPEAAVDLVWGSGVAAASGEHGHPAVRLSYRTRAPFRARFSCTRTQADGECVPVLPMRLDFTAPVSRAQLAQVRLRSSEGRVIAAAIDGEAAADTPAAPAWWRRWFDRVLAWLGRAPEARSGQGLLFRGPFEATSAYTLELPAGLIDDAGRALENVDRFPLAIRTGEDPPLVRFAARFGVVEAQAGALLPVTVRNLDGAEAAGGARGRLLRVEAPTPRELVAWIRRTQEGWGDAEARRRPLLVEAPGVRSFELPRTASDREFEVIGIPLGGPGFYVVELASRRLGAALLETEAARFEREWAAREREARESGREPPRRPSPPPQQPAPAYHVPAAALVTNLVAHFKRGRESSLVWVTSLDRGAPVAGARVRVLDCSGRVHHEALADRDGLVRIERALPAAEDLPPCVERGDRQLVVTASLGRDFTFTLSDWGEGLAPWRFNLPAGDHDGPYSLRAVLDRTLLRAGETVHMKLFARERTRAGLAVPPVDRIAGRVVIEHLGSGRRFEVPVTWNADGSATTRWPVPVDARLGEYEVRTLDRLAPEGRSAAGARAPLPGPFDETARGVRVRAVARFRVEAFRLPAMSARIAAPTQPLIGVAETAVDVQVSYLSGGGASGLPVRLRAALSPRVVTFPGHDGFVFANGDVAEGLRIRGLRGSRLGETAGGEPEEVVPEASGPAEGPRSLAAGTARLDGQGGARIPVAPLPRSARPQDLLLELEYRDAGGETLTSAARATWWPSGVVVGLRTDGWVAQRNRLRAEAVVLDPSGRPVADTAVSVDVFRSRDYSHRRRLVGGFYAFESHTEVRRIGTLCRGRTDARGRLLCEGEAGAEGNLLLRARAADAQGRPAVAHREVWVVGREEHWFEVGDSDRMDVIAESPRYEPGARARFQVRMPFREATALVTLEREGVISARVQSLSGRSPVVEVPVEGVHAPNVFVSVLAVRGRANEVQPAATVDLGRPSLRMGVARIDVGWRAHALAVEVRPERDVLRVRETARLRLRVRRADGAPLPPGAEVALAAVDEALLEIAGNDTWSLLERMMGSRGLEVNTATAQLHVVGRRHFGRKALVPGGGGGSGATRELFDTLLAWQPRVALDARGEASVEVPLNDSLSAFRFVAVASAGADLFGSGSATVRTTQPLMLISGLPPLVRGGDRYRAQATVRNTTDQLVEASVLARFRASDAIDEPTATPLPEQRVRLGPGEARTIGWEHRVPDMRGTLQWIIEASGAGTSDRLRVAQRVEPLLAARPLQATLLRADPGGALEVAVASPEGAVPGSAHLRVDASASLSGDLRAMREWMAAYPHACLEQRASRAVATGDRMAWDALVSGLPAALDRDGLARYFPSMREGSDVLTAYLLTLAAEAGWSLPEQARQTMLGGLQSFARGAILRRSDADAADHGLRRVAALAALARQGVTIEPGWLESIGVEPQRWPVAALLDWIRVLAATNLPRRDALREETLSVLRSRIVLQGSTMGLAREPGERMGWLLASPDSSAARLLLAALDEPALQGEVARMARGLIGRQREGRWDTTMANAWGSIALGRVAARLESDPVRGTTRAVLGAEHRALRWPDGARAGDPGAARMELPSGGGTLRLSHEGTGRPWVRVETHAAVPVRGPVASGFRIERTVTPVDPRVVGRWSVGDQVRVRLLIDAQVPTPWVVVSDPLPAGAAVLAGGTLAAAQPPTAPGRVALALAPDHEERAADAYRAYFRQVPQGRFVVEYVMRLSQAGRFGRPPSRVEAMYAPEMYGEWPGGELEVAP